jgi:hypothetical protein
MVRTAKRVAASVVVVLLVLLLALDLGDAGLRGWWDGHAFTASVVSNLLVLAVAGLVVDEVVARRQRKERSVSVAVQAVIVYGQVRRTYAAVTAMSGESPDVSEARDELRSLANMILVSSSNLFDDPEARLFLDEVQRLAATVLAVAVGSGSMKSNTDRLSGEMGAVEAAVKPLLARIPEDQRAALEEH